jgi:hypothetical protein
VYNYQAVIVLTEGNPTRYGPLANPGGVTFPVTTRFAEVENGIFSANSPKDEGTPVLAMGIGAGGRAVIGRAPKGARVTARAWALITATLPEVPVTG